MRSPRLFLRHCIAVILLWAFVPATTNFGEEAKPAAGRDRFILTVLNIPDVQRGAGLCVILQLPGGKTWLYDTGCSYPSEEGWAGDFNCGRDLIVPFLKQRGITELEGVFISHAHYDHFGGLIWLKDHFPVKHLVDSGYEFPGISSPNYSSELRHYSMVRDEFKKRGIYREAHTGDHLLLDDQLRIEVLAPPKTFFANPEGLVRPPNDPPAHYLVNSNSLGIRIQHGSVVFYLPATFRAKTSISACCRRSTRRSSSATCSSRRAMACMAPPNLPRPRTRKSRSPASFRVMPAG